MSKTIRVDNQVYDRLEQFRDKRETYSQAVERLLEFEARINDLENRLENKASKKEA